MSRLPLAFPFASTCPPGISLSYRAYRGYLRGTDCLLPGQLGGNR